MCFTSQSHCTAPLVVEVFVPVSFSFVLNLFVGGGCSSPAVPSQASQFSRLRAECIFHKWQVLYLEVIKHYVALVNYISLNFQNVPTFQYNISQIKPPESRLYLFTEPHVLISTLITLALWEELSAMGRQQPVPLFFGFKGSVLFCFPFKSILSFWCPLRSWLWFQMIALHKVSVFKAWLLLQRTLILSLEKMKRFF